MRFTEHELTLAVQGAAKTVVAAQSKDVRKGRLSIDEAWDQMAKYARYQVLEGVGSQILPVLIALPDVEVEAGTAPTFTKEQIEAALDQTSGGSDAGGRLRRKAESMARALLVNAALASLPPRQDPDALIVPDHL